MFTDKNGNEVTVGDTVDLDGIKYHIISVGPCSDIPEVDEVLYGQRLDDMRFMIPFTPSNMKNLVVKEN